MLRKQKVEENRLTSVLSASFSATLCMYSFRTSLVSVFALFSLYLWRLMRTGRMKEAVEFSIENCKEDIYC